MLRNAWRPIAATTGVVGASSYLWYSFATKAKPETFDLAIKVRGVDGKSATVNRTFPLLSKDQIDARINEHCVSTQTRRPGGIIWKQATATFAANDPIEDANASAIIQRDPTDVTPEGDLLFFAVMDGHGGFDTSRLLSKVLIPAITLELKALLEDPNSIIPKSSVLSDWKTLLGATSKTPGPIDANPKYVSLAIQKAFLNLDSEIINAPLRLLASHIDKETKELPDLSQHPMALASMLPAMSGSCALVALLDTAHKNLYVACSGDSRAVAGVWEEDEHGKGRWKVEVMSEDQTGRNPKEHARVRSEHPAEESQFVIRNGRVLGGLEPTRAFGDARYKWPLEVQQILNAAFMIGNDQPMRNPPSMFKTPPYVTAKPEVTHRKLSFLPLSDAPQGNKSTLRFLVLATDGLWDQLTSEEVVALVGGHLAGLKGSVAKSSLSDLIPTSMGSATVDGKDKGHKKGGKEGAWAFEDENVGAHLIRNAFGGADHSKLRKLLSLPVPLARNYRDDTTVTVVWWEDGREESVRTSTFRPDGEFKAKL
ncbi:hypothetical protein JAAARDRAFT_144975 [Jaapia argillacea MUCL 33604]|uniref:PPM-type phosphatase domain-containing protein n=1 Tax=Jaapia argillacea MUCL 33604 TaxID=933084 RepID=A0A067QDY1_9AGAM|nr:hypothetical protein JAAARDRAFT_144975 [Jaapia argillacea MUCL 33604]